MVKTGNRIYKKSEQNYYKAEWQQFLFRTFFTVHLNL